MLLELVGCNRGGGMRGERQSPAVDTDVYRVVCFFPPNMWKSFDHAGDLNPEGFAFVMYLLSRETNRGVIADGTLQILLYTVQELENGAVERHLAREWTADMSEIPRRQQTRFGIGYQPTVHWGDLNVFGERVEIVVKYESPTGRVVQGQTHATKVPKRKV